MKKTLHNMTVKELQQLYEIIYFAKDQIDKIFDYDDDGKFCEAMCITLGDSNDPRERQISDLYYAMNNANIMITEIIEYGRRNNNGK